jgi:hypothetical protein
MFRENVLVREDIIDRISETMIPVAPDYQKVLNRESHESRLVRSMIKDLGDIQGVRVMTPDGRILGKFSGFGDMAGKAKRMIEDALKKLTICISHDGIKSSCSGRPISQTCSGINSC